jgi:hypothetical protein
LSIIVDPRNARAVLVGTATYLSPELGDLPETATNVYELSDALTGPRGFLDRAYVRPMVDPHNARNVLDALSEQSGIDDGLLLFYYTGHGLLGSNDLCMGLPDSIPGERSVQRTSLQARELFAAMHRVTAKYKVAILDCCFSGLAFDASSAADIHLLTAANRTGKARSDRDRTVFTRELLHLLGNGIPDGPRCLDLTTIYRRLAVVVPRPSPNLVPTPWQRAANWTGDLCLARNVAYGTARTTEGLLARARFAEQTSKLKRTGPDPVKTAVELFEGIVADAVEQFPDRDDTVAFRHFHASLVARAGDTRKAIELLETLIRERRNTVTPDHLLKSAQASLEHWKRHRFV